MADVIGDNELREMARHRGLKLVKSRRRTPGVGDFGKFGLADAAGKAMFGIEADGLTANAAQIRDFLRSSEVGAWRQSAETTPHRPPAPQRPQTKETDEDDTPLRRRARAGRTRRGRASKELAPQLRRPRADRGTKPALRLVPKPASEPEAKSAPEPVLRIRNAVSGDAEALAALLRQLDGLSIDRAEVATNLATARKAKAGMMVAERDAIVGCCGWAALPTVHRGAIGRLTMLVVDRAHRRRGIATAMLEAVQKALAKAGCRQVEAMSDIAVNNSHSFFRSLKFEQTSYRFIRDIDA